MIGQYPSSPQGLKEIPAFARMTDSLKKNTGKKVLSMME